MGKLKFILVFTVLCNLAYVPEAWSQCSTTPVVEAVRNGDFEAGYLNGTAGGSHTFAPGGPFDFQSDLRYVGNYANNCITSIPNRYTVAKAEPGLVCTANPSQAYAGTDYINVPFTDHTPGKGGAGFALVADFEKFSDLGIAPYDQGAGGLPAAWRQVVSIYPNQQYYFSAWFANYNREAVNGTYQNPKLDFVVVPIVAGAPQWASRTSLGTAEPTGGQMNWQQFYATWTSPLGLTQVLLLIEIQEAEERDINDILIDDISFINGCANINSLPDAYIPDLGEGFSLCVTNGAATLNANVSAHANNQFFWYSGTTNPQTVLASTVSTLDITTPGTYRVCVQNAAFLGSCSASSTIVVTNTMPPVSLNNQNICTATTVTLTALQSSGATYTGSGLTYAWTRPATAPASVNSPTYTTGVTGTYSVTVTPGAGATAAGCLPVVSNNATVTSNLVTPSFVSSNCAVNPHTFTLTSTNGAGNTYGWYDAAAGGSLKGKGQPGTVSYTPGQLPATVYLENYTSTEVAPLKTSATASSAGAVANAQTMFIAQQNFTIESIWIRSIFGTGVVNLTLQKDAMAGAASASFNVTALNEWYQVPLNWAIVAGSTYFIDFHTPMWLSVQDPFTQTNYGGLVTINANTPGASGAAIQWTVRTGNNCLRSPFVLDCSLPVTYLSFEAQKKKDQVILHWSTASEQNAELFIIERSHNGTDYYSIGEVKASNSPAGSSYTFVDEIPAQANSYYRLRQLDFNGSMDVSEVRYVSYSSEGTLSVLPNPAQNAIKVVLKSTINHETGVASIHVSNMLAQEIYTTTVNANELSTGVSLDLSSLKPGVYMIKVISSEGEWMEKLIKE